MSETVQNIKCRWLPESCECRGVYQVRVNMRQHDGNWKTQGGTAAPNVDEQMSSQRRIIIIYMFILFNTPKSHVERRGNAE